MESNSDANVVAKVEKDLNKAYFSENCDEREILESLPNFAPKGVDCIVDFGASLGQYTKFFNENNRGVKIIAVEADPIRFQILEKNCKEWAEEAEKRKNQIIPLNIALSDVDGEIPFLITNSGTSGCVFAVDKRHKNSTEVQVKSKSLDSFLAQNCANKKNIFIKMDIEGAEYRAIRSFTGKSTPANITLFVEVHDWGDPAQKLYPWHFFEMMNNCGYSPLHFKRHYVFSTTSNRSRIWNKVYSLKHLVKHWLRKVPFYYPLKNLVLAPST